MNGEIERMGGLKIKTQDQQRCFAASDCSAIRDFLAAIVEMTDAAAKIDKRSIVRPGVTLKTEARRLLKRIK